MSCSGWCLSFRGWWEALQEHQGIPMAGSCLAWDSQGPVCSADAAEGLVPPEEGWQGQGQQRGWGRGIPRLYLGPQTLGPRLWSTSWLPRGKESTCQCRRCKRCGFNPWVEKIPWRRKWQPTPVFLPGEFHGQRSLTGYSPWGRKESDTTKRSWLP